MPGGLGFLRLWPQEAAEVPPPKGEEKHSGCHGPEEYPRGTHTKIIVYDLACLRGALHSTHGIQQPLRHSAFLRR